MVVIPRCTMELPEVLHGIEKYGVIPVLVVDRPEAAIPLADALIEGGLPVAEVTFRTASAADVLRRLRAERPSLLLGAGTVLSPQTAVLAAECGARFLVAPGLNPAVVRMAADLGLAMVPGVLTPSEVERAVELGCRALKVFPVEVAGGVRLVQALCGPYAGAGVRFVPTGGVTASNLADYLRVDAVMAVGGTWIANREDIAQGRWAEIAARCREAVAIADRTRLRAPPPVRPSERSGSL